VVIQLDGHDAQRLAMTFSRVHCCFHIGQCSGNDRIRRPYYFMCSARNTPVQTPELADPRFRFPIY
jgi:hypothetical protein